MPAWIQMFDPLNIPRPLHVLWVLGPGNDKPGIRHDACGLEEKFVNLRLVVCGVRSHVAEIALKSFVDFESAVFAGV